MKLLDIIQEVRRNSRTDLANLTVMSAATDTYRQCAGIEARWFAEQMERFCPCGQIHLRGLHYRVVAAGDVLRPDRTPYINSDVCWSWLERAGKSARWLNHGAFHRITDARNDPPEIFIPDK